MNEGMIGWTCLGPGKPHPMASEEVEAIRRFRDEIIRCRACGQLYRYECIEVNDWSGGHDYCDSTHIWTAIDPDEPEAIRRDGNYKPRGGRIHRHDTGWQAT